MWLVPPPRNPCLPLCCTVWHWGDGTGCSGGQKGLGVPGCKSQEVSSPTRGCIAMLREVCPPKNLSPCLLRAGWELGISQAGCAQTPPSKPWGFECCWQRHRLVGVSAEWTMTVGDNHQGHGAAGGKSEGWCLGGEMWGQAVLWVVRGQGTGRRPDALGTVWFAESQHRACRAEPYLKGETLKY